MNMNLRIRRKTRLTTYIRIISILLLIFTFLDLLLVRRHQYSHPLPTPSRAETSDFYKGTRLFIASTHWNNEAVLRGRWNDAIVEIARYFGPKNIYVSVYESGSWDDTKGALRELEVSLAELGVERTIVLDKTTHQDEIDKGPQQAGGDGWIETPRGRKELRRIPYLSNIRNKALQPLWDMASSSSSRDSGSGKQHAPRKFDKILFLNDVYFSIPQLLELLSTNEGRYAAACALDFSKAPAYYDTFALRDTSGEEPMMSTWPYFRSSKSRSALKRNEDVPVMSCWNGMVIMPAEPFYDQLQPLKFRGVSDQLAKQHLEGSECCLIHADNPYSPGRGVWLNPRVRVGYNEAAYKAVKDEDWLGSWNILWGSWKNRILRWTTSSYFTRKTVEKRLGAFEKKNSGRAESGWYCLINEMQVLVHNG